MEILVTQTGAWLALPLSLTLTIGLAAQAKEPFPLPGTNSRAVVLQQVASTNIEVTYHRPSVRGRVIFGGLVPYGQVWRTGSDNATLITFSTPVSLNGTAVDSGAYELFSIPGREEWVIILQPARSQWGSYGYDPAHDAARFTATPIALSSSVENFTIGFADVTTDAATMNILWDQVQVPIRVTVDVRATVVPRLEAALRGEGRKPYFQAAMFYYENNLDLDRAVALMTLALEANPGHIGMLYRLALIEERRGDRMAAIAASEQSLAGAMTSPPELRDEYTRLNTALLARLRND
jgi:hypothetical protein